jgi:hypothetical protein
MGEPEPFGHSELAKDRFELGEYRLDRVKIQTRMRQDGGCYPLDVVVYKIHACEQGRSHELRI